jgi:peptidoglycan/xylan/chitin deacetylase (PgdA/CDA1 family)
MRHTMSYPRVERGEGVPVPGRMGWPGVGAALLAGWHLGPAATWLPPVRALTPALAGRGRADHVALTFDDGPSAESTPEFLRVLEAAGVRATFFMVGERLARRPGIGRAVADAGHEVAVHGFEHRYLLGRSPWHVHADLARARDLVGDITGTAPRWFRPPYGVLTGDAALAARLLGLRPVLWTAWGRDWTAAASPRSVEDTIAPGIRGGATLLLHDAGYDAAPGAWRSAVGALPGVIDRARALGYRVGPLAEHGVEVRRRG